MPFFVQTFIGVLLALLWLLVLGRVLMSWVDPMGRSQLGAFLIQTTEPILAPVRRVMPQTGMFDFSSLIVLLVLGALWRAFL
ncbi:MAG TPA: YggT family protein [Candidatus Limnocylindrales bacterium]|nr:YggT family protein [Candidatus Limnocylindrales bacterium]